MNQEVLNNYFKNQAGTGLVAYSGPKYQRGHGLNFGRIFRKLKPALRYIGRHGLRTLTNIGRDLIEGENFSETTKNHLKNTGKRIAGEMMDKADSYLDQSGKGLIVKPRKKYKRRKRTLTKKKSKSIRKKSKTNRKKPKAVRKKKKVKTPRKKKCSNKKKVKSVGKKRKIKKKTKLDFL